MWDSQTYLEVIHVLEDLIAVFGNHANVPGFLLYLFLGLVLQNEGLGHLKFLLHDHVNLGGKHGSWPSSRVISVGPVGMGGGESLLVVKVLLLIVVVVPVLLRLRCG